MRKLSAGLTRSALGITLKTRGFRLAGASGVGAVTVRLPPVLIRLMGWWVGQRLKARATQRGPTLSVRWVCERAWEMSYELAPEHERRPFDDFKKDPVTGTYWVSQREPCRYAELNGQTRLDWAKAQCRTIADSGEIHVFEEWTLHRN